MQFVSALSEASDASVAMQELCDAVRQQLRQAPCALVVVFVSQGYAADWGQVVRQIHATLGQPVLIGCGGSGVIGSDRELEGTPAMSIVAAHLPEVEVHPFTVSTQELEGAEAGRFWMDKLGVQPPQDPVFILLPDPYTCDAMALVAQLGDTYPRRPCIGGLASGASGPGRTVLFLNDQLLHEGAVGVALTGNIVLETIVSQGCRPVGRHYIVTGVDQQVLLTLAGRPALDIAAEVLAGLSTRDRALAQHSLFLGVVMNEQRHQFRRGDFLIRNLVGIDPTRRGLVVGDLLGVGQTVQFQLRDASTSAEDLRALLHEQADQLRARPPAGALLFSCCGRGKHLYGTEHHDIRTIRELTGSYALAGFFCNGEIGPIGGRNFLHGYTSSLGFFRAKTA